MTTPEENAATVKELIQKVLNEGDIGFAEKTLSESYVERSPMPGGTAWGNMNPSGGWLAAWHLDCQQFWSSALPTERHSTVRPWPRSP